MNIKNLILITLAITSSMCLNNLLGDHLENQLMEGEPTDSWNQLILDQKCYIRCLIKNPKKALCVPNCFFHDKKEGDEPSSEKLPDTGNNLIGDHLEKQLMEGEPTDSWNQLILNKKCYITCLIKQEKQALCVPKCLFQG